VEEPRRDLIVRLAVGAREALERRVREDDSEAERVERPVAFGEVFATLYHNLGIDVNKTTINDLAGRPQYLVDAGCQPMKELI
jgi:hypothetical protein